MITAATSSQVAPIDAPAVDPRPLDQVDARTPLLGHVLPRDPGAARREGQQEIRQHSSAWRKFTAFLVGTGVFLAGAGMLVRGLAAAGSLGITEGLWALTKAIVRGLSNCCNGTQAVSPDAFRVNLPGNTQVQLNAAILPQRIPQDMTSAELQGQIQEKITRGHALYQSITTGQAETPATLRNVTDLCFFLQAKGESLKGNFSQGAFSIPDPGCRVRTFLDSCPQAYQRLSSHIGDFQGTAGGKHRGIDCEGSATALDTFMPYGKGSLLYGSLAQSEERQMPEDRLWLKMESHGAWLTSAKNGSDADGPHRHGTVHDVGAFIGHSLSFLETRGQGSAAGTFKERIPDRVKNEYRALREGMPEDIKTILDRNDPTNESKGIRVMVRNAADAVARDPGEPARGRLEAFLTSVRERYDHTNVRIGNEVILTAADFG